MKVSELLEIKLFLVKEKQKECLLSGKKNWKRKMTHSDLNKTYLYIVKVASFKQAKKLLDIMQYGLFFLFICVNMMYRSLKMSSAPYRNF